MRRPRDERSFPVTALVVHDACLLAAVFYAPLYWGGFTAAGQSFAAWLIGIAALAALAARFSGGLRLALIPNAVHLPLAVFLAISAVSALFSVSVHASSLELSRLAMGALLFGLVANRAAMPPAPAKPVAALFACFAVALPFVHVAGEADITLDLFSIAAAVLVCALMLADSLRPDPIRWYWQAMVMVAAFPIALTGLKEKLINYFVLKNPTWRIFATFFNPNPLGGYLAMNIPVALSAAVAAARRWRRALWAVAAALLVLALLPTYSKGALVGLMAAMVVWAVLIARASANPRRNLCIALGSFALLGVAALVTLAVSSSLRARVFGMLGSESASNMFRVLTWKSTLMMAADHLWLGIGPGAFKHAFPRYAIVGYVEAAHENYLQILAEQGVLGAAAFLWLMGAVLFTGLRAVRRAPSLGEKALSIGALGAVTVLLVHSLFDYDWYIGAIGLNFWLLAGLLAHGAHGRAVQAAEEPSARTTRGRGARRRRASLRPGPWQVAGALCLIGVVAACITVSTRNALAQRAANRASRAIAAAQRALQEGDVEQLRAQRAEAERYLQAAVDYAPNWPQVLSQLGLIKGGTEGEELIKRAVSLEPTDFQWRVALAQHYQRNGDLETALTYYQQALERFPISTRLLRQLAETKQKLGDEESALELYRCMVEMEHSPYQRYRALDVDVDTEYAYAHYHLGRAAQREGLPTEAVHEFQEVLRVIGDYQYRGKKTDEMFAAVGRPREDRAGKLQVLEAMTRWRLSEAYRKLGDAQTADIHAQIAAELLPEVAQMVAREDAGEIE